VELEFLAKSEVLEFNEVDGFSAVCFDDFVGDGKWLKVCIYNGVFVFGSNDFKGFVRGCSLALFLVR
jgi:hypothetical protein